MLPKTYNQLPYGYDLPTDIFFSPNDVLSGLSPFKNRFSNGPDNISVRCLFNCRHVIAYPIFLLFRRPLSESVFPSVWKISEITPIFKSGDSFNIKNYRPISIILLISSNLSFTQRLKET